jgi:hypothetical protein
MKCFRMLFLNPWQQLEPASQICCVQVSSFTFWHRIFFLILAHPVYEMWIIQEPNTLELWNELHFKKKKNGEYILCLKYSVLIFIE